MQSFAALSLLGLILTFLATALGGFPLSPAPDSANPSEYTVQDVGNRFLSVYYAVVEDIASFQDDPSVERALARSDSFMGYGQSVAQDYQDFSSQLIQNWGQLSDSPPVTESTPVNSGN